MNRGVFGEATLAGHARQGLPEGRCRERRLPVARGAHPGPRARTRPGEPQPLQGPVGRGPQAVLAPLARSDTHQHARGGDVRALPRRPFPQAQPTRLEHLPTQAGCRALGQGQQGAHCLRPQADGQLLAGPGTTALEDGPRALPRVLGEEPEAIEMDAPRPRPDLPLMDQVAGVRPNPPCTDRSGSPPVVLRQGSDGFEIAWLGPGGQAPEW
jgi:hypothetical protein